MGNIIKTGIGAVGGAISYFFGGWDTAIHTLIIFMAIDFISGLIVAGVFKNSGKTDSGTLSSLASWKGLFKKVMSLLFVAVAVRLDMLLDTTFVRDAVIIALISNEALSILENAGLMGLNLPAPIIKAIEILNKKSESGGTSDENN